VVLVGGALGIRHWTSGSSSNQVGVTFRPPPLAGTQTILLTDSATPAAYDVLTGKESWGKGDGQSPAISQRRNQVAYLTQEGANAFGHPVVGTAAGTGMSPLLTGRSRIDCPLSARPAWAPGDTRFALLCYQGDGSYAGLWLVTSGGGAQQLRGSADSCRCGVTWAGAGHLIYGVRKGGSGTTLEVLDVATRSSAPLVTTGAPTSLWNTDPDWTSFGPGGKVVFLNSPGNGKPGQVCVVTVDAHVRQVGSTVPCEAQDALYPTWSPTGGSIAYLRGTESNQHLWIKNDPGGLGKDTGVAGLLGPPAWGSR
jgi:hypothetical protein